MESLILHLSTDDYSKFQAKNKKWLREMLESEPEQEETGGTFDSFMKERSYTR